MENENEEKEIPRRLITLEESNKRVFDKQEPLNRRIIPNGIECPQCKSELLDDRSFIMASNPAQINTHCSNKECDYKGRRFI